MAVEVIWDDEHKTVIRHIYRGFTTVDDYLRATDLIYEMACLVPEHTVDVILDRREVRSTPSVLLRVMRYADQHLPPNLGLSVIIKPSMFTRVIVDMGRRLAPSLTREVYFAETLEEAHAIIQRKRAERAEQAQA